MTDFDPQTDTGFLDTATPRPDENVAGWSPERGRLLGALIEKALATPQNYPLSLNALTMACNQTTNRDPIMDLTESEVQGLLDEGKTDGLLRFVHPRSGRGVTKYRHVVDEALTLSTEEVALIGVLLLRGPQTVNELRTRTERLAGFADNEAVESTLRDLSARSPLPLVRLLDREPGHREQRWIQLVCPSQGEGRVGQAPASSPRHAAGSSAPSAAAPVAATTAAATAATTGESGAGMTAGSAAELAAVKAELAETRAELAALRAEFESFRAEFG